MVSETLRQQSAIVRAQTACRLCGSPALVPLWSFGTTPLANAYIRPDQVGEPHIQAPLNVQRCHDCHLVQLREVVDPTVLFGDYLYVSSTSPSFVQHFAAYAAHLIERFQLKSRDLVVDVGSNDGVLLKPLQAGGVRVLGIEPATAIAAAANQAGLETLPVFLTPPLAAQIVASHGPARVVTANNVFAHTDEVASFVEAVKVLLKPEGVFVFEVQYLGDLLQNNLFDIVYHEHLCYFHVHPLVAFFAAQGLEVFDVQRQSVHGGSIRVFVQRAGGPHERSARVADMVRQEDQQGLNTLAPYQRFSERITRNKEQLQALLADLRQLQQRIVGYGAPAKATTLLHVLGIGRDTLEYIVDDSPLKQGRLMPGLRIPIVPATTLYENKPDYCLILAWNFAEAIRQTHRRFTAQGGQFIIPVPTPRLV